ncbi:SNF5-domain-containing protein [Xylona heveae TC161]|uniref:SNF5-domain-containing protein n=1 Tax=Xylona heveae (strain CBS 132557 / TC161) TaxID=1328760 RepID=A0A165FWP0_XYLHT|nr:SNF5-domain-containing protein [Xylona heveae TC161]KZF21475.1 SNF5-domain-containing protein [Xylona heveae TC161]
MAAAGAAAGASVASGSVEDGQKEQSTSSPIAPNEANGAPQARKRSRSGTKIASQPVSSELAHRPRPPTKELLLDQYVTRDQLHTAALNTQNAAQAELLRFKREEVDLYKSLRQDRQLHPGAIFGSGYAGYGNGHTDDKPRVVYPLHRKRPGGRRTRELRISRKDLATQAEQLEELVPVRLDIEWDKIKLRDTFTWNLHDRVIKPELFAELLVEDFNLPQEISGLMVQQVGQSLADQIQDFYPHVYIDEEALDPHLAYFAYKNDEMRILIKLNITIGQHTLVDQFEWEINNPLNSPEEFAKQMTRDLSLTGEFTTAIAHNIREQAQLFTKSLYITGHPFDGRPIEDADLREAFLPTPLPSVFRPVQAAKDYTPYLYELNENELERTEVSLSREQRRQKRSINRRGGPALPDLKDRQRTVRSLLVSTVLPGAAESVDESRIFKRSAAQLGKGRRAITGPRDEESEESESEESAPDSPATSSHMLSGTARTRGMRGAASAAQAAMRATLGRSATPEASLLHHHETRTSRRSGRDYRDESVSEPTTLVVRLRIPRERFRQFLREQKSRQRGDQSTMGRGQRAASQSATPQQGTPVPGSMGPPPTTPAMHQQQLPNQPLVATPQMNGGTGGTTPQQYGIVDATHPPVAGQPGPPPPAWLTAGLTTLQSRYPRDMFEGTMRYTAVDALTDQPLPSSALQAGQPNPPNVKYQYFPRIRCHDCPGKLYTPGPDMTVENFEVHLRNRQHRERVERRVRGF